MNAAVVESLTLRTAFSWSSQLVAGLQLYR